MERKEAVADGFFLALHVLESLGVEYDRQALLNRLADVAAGNTSLLNSPAEELASLEQKRNAPFSDEERETILRHFANRRGIDAQFQAMAADVVAVMGQEGLRKRE
jgi:hypothetical protein